MASGKTCSLHAILGIVLFGVALFVTLSMNTRDTQADAVSTQLEVTNNAPTVSDVFINNSAYTFADSFVGGTIILVAGGQKTVHVTGNVRDTNGRGDISSVELKFFKTIIGSGCILDSNDCYEVQVCSTRNDTEGDLEILEYDCPVDLDYWTDSTSLGGTSPASHWTTRVVVTDNASATGSDTSTTKEIGTLLALDIPTAIDYGTLSKGERTTSANNQHMLLGQRGNDVADVEVSGADMTCTNTGTIPYANQEWSLSDTDHSASGSYDLSGTAVDTNIAIGYKTSTDVSKNLYWNIELPAQDVSGVCTGTMTVIAKAA